MNELRERLWTAGNRCNAIARAHIAIEIKNQARGRSLARQLWAIPRLMEYSVNPITWRRQRTASSSVSIAGA
jgi:hypothetical protein